MSSHKFYKFVPPTAEENSKVESLQRRAKEASLAHSFGDTTCLRFLRERLGDEEVAFEYMTTHSTWRGEFKPELLNEEVLAAEYAKQKVTRYGRDREGRPIVVIFARRHDKKDRDLEVLKKQFVCELEALMAQTHPDEEQLTIIFDLTSFGMKNMDYDAVKVRYSFTAALVLIALCLGVWDCAPLTLPLLVTYPVVGVAGSA